MRPASRFSSPWPKVNISCRNRRLSSFNTTGRNYSLNYGRLSESVSRLNKAMTLPGYAAQISPEPDMDHWVLATLRLIQFQDLGNKANYDINSIPAYTRDGFDRVQNLRLTVAEAQFASQFNGARSIAQIAKNLRLDLKFARLTLFRFLALEIVECWPATTAGKPERRGVFQRLGRSIGIGE